MATTLVCFYVLRSPQHVSFKNSFTFVCTYADLKKFAFDLGHMLHRGEGGGLSVLIPFQTWFGSR